MRRIAALVGALATALALTACAPSAEHDGRLALIADSTAGVGTARMTMTFTMAMPPMGEVTSVLEGVLDTATSAMEATMRVSMAEADLGEQTGEIIVIDGHQYQRGALVQGFGPEVGPEQWVRQPLPEGMDTGFAGPGGTSPLALLEQLAAAGGRVSDRGTEELRGTEVRRWQVETTVGELLAAQGEDALPAGMADQLDAAFRDAPTTVDIWADEADVARRVRQETDLAAALAGTEGEGEAAYSIVDLELHDLGIDVEISAPPAAEVVDYDDLGDGPFGAAAPEPPGPAPAIAGGVGEAVALDAGAAASSTHELRSPPPGVRGPLARLPYPAGAERRQVSAARVIYTVPVPDDLGAGDPATGNLEAFYRAQLPEHGWTIVGVDRSAAGGPDGEVIEVTELAIEGHDAAVRIILESDGVREVLAVLEVR
jgi:hypothetical protein